MASKPFLDSNILLYAATLGDSRTATATDALMRGAVISTQVLSEFTTVARRKLRMTWGDIDRMVALTLAVCPAPLAVSLAIYQDGCRICERYGYQLYDGQIIAAALAAGSTDLLSEDMQHGQVIDGRLTIRNPFAPPG